MEHMIAQVYEVEVNGEGKYVTQESGKDKTTEASRMQDLNKDDLVFGETKRVTVATLLLENKVEVNLKLKRGCELELYAQSPIMRLRGNSKELLYLLA